MAEDSGTTGARDEGHVLKGRRISRGRAKGSALVLSSSLSFLGGVDTQTGRIKDRETGAFNMTVRDRVLVFPTGKGSTVGSYVIYQLKANGKAPVAIINEETEAIVATGAILSKIPLVDRVDISQIRTGDRVMVDGDQGEVVVFNRGGG